MCVCVFVYVCVYIYVYIHTHMYNIYYIYIYILERERHLIAAAHGWSFWEVPLSELFLKFTQVQLDLVYPAPSQRLFF